MTYGKPFFPASRGRAAFSVTNLQSHYAESKQNENGACILFQPIGMEEVENRRRTSKDLEGRSFVPEHFLGYLWIH